MRKKLWIVTLVMAIVTFVSAIFTACDSGVEPPSGPQKLSTPFVSISATGEASWNAVSNAVGYTYKIDDGSETNTTATSVQLSDGQGIIVKAVGDGASYVDSDYCAKQTYHASGSSGPQATPLSSPFVSISNAGLASWTAVPNAVGYKYKIDGGTELSTTATSVQLSNGQSIVVKAVGDGTTYTDSPYSASQTYTAQSGPQTTPLATPFVIIDESGLASWTAVPNAVGYSYKINGGADRNTASTSVQLSNGESIVVKAVGDGTTYTDSAYSTQQTYTAQGGSQNNVLSTPVVTISNAGLASWTAVPNASGYKYKIDGGAELSLTATSIQLTNGQSITVKAVGDGTSYLDSAYSAVKSYIYTPSVVVEPTYLSIGASGSEPTAQDGVPSHLLPSPAVVSLRSTVRPVNYMGGMMRPVEMALEEYFGNSQNHLGDTLPSASAYDYYATAGSTVYVQIWLNNPAQHTILSLKLNGVKYQIGGGLSSFFISEGGVHYNCVYVAVPLPATAFDNLSYEVTEIEYISGTYINQDGADQFMNENDTVTIGLPYEGEKPAVTAYQADEATVNSYRADVTVTDESDFLTKTGGWLRAIIFDGYNVIGQQKIALGGAEVSATGLLENSYYQVYIILYADLHDGNGVWAHVVGSSSYMTLQAVTLDVCEEVREYDNNLDKHYSSIHVATTLNSPTAEYLRLEIYTDTNLPAIYVNEDYDGNQTISEGLQSGTGYTVRVYFKDNEYPEGRYVEGSVWLSYLYDVYLLDVEYYSMPNDVVLDFRVGNNDPHGYVQDFTMYLYDEMSPQYIASYVLQLIDNPDLITEKENRLDELDSLIRNLDWNNDPDVQTKYNEYREEREVLYEEVNVLSRAQNYWTNYHSEMTERSDWEAEAEKGWYYATYTYSRTGESDIVRVGKKYYVVVEDYYNYPIYGNYFNLSMKVVANIDELDGSDVQQKEFTKELSDDNRFSDYMGDMTMKNVWMSEEHDQIGFELVNGDMYSQVEGDAENLNLNVTYVYKITISGTGDWDYYGDDGLVLYSLDTVPTLNIDEGAWAEEYLAKLSAGEAISDLAVKYAGAYEPVVMDIPSISAGNWYLRVFTRAYCRDYEGDAYVDKIISTESFRIESTLPVPNVYFTAYNGEAHATLAPVTQGGGSSGPNGNGGAQVGSWPTENGFPSEWEIEYIYSVVDAEGNPVVTEQTGGIYAFYRNFGYQIRFKAHCTIDNSAWLDSEWSEWVAFTGEKLSPLTIIYSWSENGARWESDWNASGYVYKIGESGEEQTMNVNEMFTVPLAVGETLFVKTIAKTDGDDVYADSDWAEYTVVDTREKLATPQNFRYESNRFVWDEVSGASQYQIIDYVTGDIEYTLSPTQHFIKGFGEFAVRAVPEDIENYAPSEWTEAYLLTATLADPTFNRYTERNDRLQWNSVENAEEYFYRVNDGEEVSNGRYAYVTLASLNMALGDKLYVQARASGATSSGWALIYTITEQLATPVLTAGDGTVSWEAIEHATAYEYTVDGGEVQTTAETSLSGLTAGQVVRVCAISSDECYTKSAEASVTVTQKAPAPVVTVDSSGLAKWTGVANRYTVKVNGAVVSENSLMTQYQLADGDSIEVMQNASGNWLVSDYSASQTYSDTREKLASPTVTYRNGGGLSVTFHGSTFDTSYQVEWKCGENGTVNVIGFFGSIDNMGISSFVFPEGSDYNVYVRIVAVGSLEYAPSEWVVYDYSPYMT